MTEDVQKAAWEYHDRLSRARDSDPTYRERKWYGEDVIDAFAAGVEFARAADHPADDAAPGAYACGCPAVRSDNVKAFCPTHHKVLIVAPDPSESRP